MTRGRRSSLPVATNGPMEVRIRRKSEARKKCSAGSAGSFAGTVAEAAIDVKFHGSTRRREPRRTAVKDGTKDNASGARGESYGSGECGAGGFAREVGDGERGRRSDIGERDRLCSRNARKARDAYAKGPQRNGAERPGVARRRQRV